MTTTRSARRALAAALLVAGMVTILALVEIFLPPADAEALREAIGARMAEDHQHARERVARMESVSGVSWQEEDYQQAGLLALSLDPDIRTQVYGLLFHAHAPLVRQRGPVGSTR